MNSKYRLTNLISSVEKKMGRVSIFPAILCIAITLFYCQSSFAQDSNSPMQATKYKNVKWYGIGQIAFKPGKMDDAMGLVKKYFMPAGKAAGNPGPVMVLENQTGAWDVTVIWLLKDGPSDLEWKVSPEAVASDKELLKLVGSKEKVKKIREEWVSDIARSSYNVALQEDAFAGGGK